jgi:hypothetical protein
MSPHAQKEKLADAPDIEVFQQADPSDMETFREPVRELRTATQPPGDDTAETIPSTALEWMATVHSSV